MSLCPFCPPDRARIFHADDLVIGLWDGFPVSPGHALLITRRHVESWFAANVQEQAALTAAIAIARAAIEERHRPAGFNLGVNIGAAGGQTVPHLHLHVIPRYIGDVADPRGGVRQVVPARANYLSLSGASGGSGFVFEPSAIESAVDLSPATDELPPDGSLPWRYLVRGEDDPLLPHLLRHLDEAYQFDLVAAFVLESGVVAIEPQLADLLERGGRARILTGDYLGITEPRALLRLLDLGGDHPDRLETRVFESTGSSFHPKAYLFHSRSADHVAYVGSSNLSRTALAGGLEWNYRVVLGRDRKAFEELERGFTALFNHSRTRPLDGAWIDRYRLRREAAAAVLRPETRIPEATAGVEPEPPPPRPEPTPVQLEALARLAETRTAGECAGLVVMATGLGKTWLAAFDSEQAGARRVLFVAHREEILRQAQSTFRALRPDARIGFYMGDERDPGADILLASVQTLGRAAHLERFARDAFDYVVVDEFHHSAARSYRGLIEHFEPRFLLGLTATPERSDGGDLLSICGENLVFRCDMMAGIRRGLLVPFHYFGVPDEVDYTNIPWRSAHFDEQALTRAVATERRAANALEQYRRRAGRRTLAFCCSQLHADFMAGIFRDSGLRVAAVHAGPNSDPRATSLGKLAEGQLDVVFAVDMLNEGVDLPAVDTVMMLRPTTSRILWLQQFGRGLRNAPGKDRLTVIDYIGNHRVFLLKPQTLLGLEPGSAPLVHALELMRDGDFRSYNLPPGCEVEYELEAVDILRALVPRASAPQALREWYEEFRDRHGERPRAVEALHEGLAPRSARTTHGSWLRFVSAMGDMSPDERTLVSEGSTAGFLDALETTQMTRAYKMVVLQALLAADCLPGEMTIEQLGDGFARVARRSARLTAELSVGIDDPGALRGLLEREPIPAWTGGRGTAGVAYFAYENGRVRSTFDVPRMSRAAFQELVRELVEWRLGEYLGRSGPARESGDARIVCKVSHAGGQPMLFLPDRGRHPGLPSGWTDVDADGERLEANFVKVAVNVMRRPGAVDNLLPEILHRWFGDHAGQPGTDFHVAFELAAERYRLVPLATAETAVPTLWKAYRRDEIPSRFGLPVTNRVWQSGFVWKGNHMFLLVTLEKDDLPPEHRYEDRFIAPDTFQWQSQNRTPRDGKVGRALRGHREQGVHVHLFVRRSPKRGGRGTPFIYCGEVDFVDWDGDQPITVRWRLREPAPPELLARLTMSK